MINAFKEIPPVELSCGKKKNMHGTRTPKQIVNKYFNVQELSIPIRKEERKKRKRSSLEKAKDNIQT